MVDQNPYRSPTIESESVPVKPSWFRSVVRSVISFKGWLISLGLLVMSIVMSIIGGLADMHDIISRQTVDVIFVVAMIVYFPSYVVVMVGLVVGACKLGIRLKRKWFG